MALYTYFLLQSHQPQLSQLKNCFFKTNWKATGGFPLCVQCLTPFSRTYSLPLTIWILLFIRNFQRLKGDSHHETCIYIRNFVTLYLIACFKNNNMGGGSICAYNVNLLT